QRDAEDIINRTKSEAEEYEKKKMVIWTIRGIMFGVYALSGGLAIWFIERTLRLNKVDLDDEVGDSGGQMIANVVGIFTTVGFLYEVAKKKRNDRELRAEMKEAERKIIVEASKRRLAALQRESFGTSLETRSRRSRIGCKSQHIRAQRARQSQQEPGVSG